MKFVLKDEVLALIKINVLDDLTEDNDILLNKVELIAISEIDSYIGSKYNLDAVFNRVGDDRNMFLINLVVDIMLYHLHSRLTPNFIPEIRVTRYDKAISYLYEVSKGKIAPNIPLNVLPINSRSSESLYGSETKVNDVQY